MTLGRAASGEPTLVIIPAYNEEESLGAVLDELTTFVRPRDVVVVSDGSLDRTADIARRAGVAVVELPYNLGIGGALRTGFKYAVRQGYNRAVQFDADGQHCPGEIAALERGLEAGADLVIGSRFASESVEYRVGRARRLAMTFLAWFVRTLIHQPLTDTSSGFRGFSSRALGYFAATYPIEYLDSVEALVLADAEGLVIAEVPVQMRERLSGQPSARNFRLAYYYVRLLIVMTLRIGKRRHPVEASV
jgi:glycosyltransferase involved in cell wall biosynthesis